jgi:hypothetical protein
MLDDEPVMDGIDIRDMVEVAFRNNNGIYWTNRIAHMLPDNTPVYSLDNTAKGIYTIGDIKREK